MRTRSELECIELLVKSTHDNWMSKLVIDDSKEYDPESNSSLGYCFKYLSDTTGNKIYTVVCNRIGNEDLDFRIYMHEIGHLYLGHLDEIHLELDTLMCNSIRDNFNEITERINSECGIDFGDKLLKRIIDDPEINHSFHNIAMDMEVNTKVLSSEDIELLEKEITSIMQKKKIDALKLIADKSEDEGIKKSIEESIQEMEKQVAIKLMLPERFHTSEIGPDGKPLSFPDQLTYTEYLLMMLRYADQFVKALVSFNLGGNGDTSQITAQQIQQALNDYWNSKSDEYKKGYQQAMDDLKDGLKNSQDKDQSSNGNQQGQDLGNASGGGMGNGGSGQHNVGDGNGGSGQHNVGDGNGGSPKSDYDQGYQDALRDAAEGLTGKSGMQMRGLDSLMGNLGMKSGQKKGEGRQQIDREDTPHKKDDSNSGSQDHSSDSRKQADEKRLKGEIQPGGGTGCGSQSSSSAELDANALEIDDVDSAINEVVRNVKNRVVKISNKRDVMRLYNRGIERKVIRPVISQRINLSIDPKIVFLIDVSGSMNTTLIQRILKTISKELIKLNRSLKFDIISWNTELSDHFKDIDPKKPLPKIHVGGGTSMAKGMRYFANNYDKNAILVLISDFEDDLGEWHKVEDSMSGYDLYAWNYGRYNNTKVKWTRLKQRNFSDYGYVESY